MEHQEAAFVLPARAEPQACPQFTCREGDRIFSTVDLYVPPSQVLTAYYRLQRLNVRRDQASTCKEHCLQQACLKCYVAGSNHSQTPAELREDRPGSRTSHVQDRGVPIDVSLHRITLSPPGEPAGCRRSGDYHSRLSRIEALP